MLLALETANDQCSVALWQAGSVVSSRLDTRPREQTRMLLPMIDAVMQEAACTWSQLEAIAFSRGPASFSGIRINAAVAQALAWAHDLKVVPISTLQAVAQAYVMQSEQPCPRIMVIMDARMNEVYAAAYQWDQGALHLVGGEQLAGYDAVVWPAPWQDQAVAVVGSGVSLVTLPKQAMQYPVMSVHAMHIAQLAEQAIRQGQQVEPALGLPVYLRDNAWKKLADQGRR